MSYIYNKEDDKKCMQETRVIFRQKKRNDGNCFPIDEKECKTVPKSVWVSNLEVCVPQKKYMRFKLTTLINKKLSDQIKEYSKGKKELFDTPPVRYSSVDIPRSSMFTGGKPKRQYNKKKSRC